MAIRRDVEGMREPECRAAGSYRHGQIGKPLALALKCGHRPLTCDLDLQVRALATNPVLPGLLPRLWAKLGQHEQPQRGRQVSGGSGFIDIRNEL